MSIANENLSNPQLAGHQGTKGAVNQRLDYIYLPWHVTLNKIKLRDATVSLWSGDSELSTSIMLGQVMLSGMRQNRKVCVVEQKSNHERLVAQLIRQAAGVVVLSEQYESFIYEYLKHGLYLIDSDNKPNPQCLIRDFEYAHQLGYSLFFINYFNAPEFIGREEQEVFIKALRVFCRERSVQVHALISSLVLGATGNEFMSELVDNIFFTEPNKEKTLKQLSLDGQEKETALMYECDTYLTTVKQKGFEFAGSIGLYYDSEVGVHRSLYGQKNFQFVPYPAELVINENQCGH